VTLHIKWNSILDNIDLAFQPIVDIKTGKLVAVESLLRNYREVGFNSIDEFFDTAYEDQVIFSIDILLRKKALEKLKKLYKKNKNFSLFYNIDNRILDMADYQDGHTIEILNKYGYKKDFITFEISEKHEFMSFIDAQTIFRIYSEQGFSIALDDFGSGFSGLKMLYYLNPQYIKIDRFFISDILNDKKKKIFVESIVKMAQKLNIKVLAEGVETKDEFDICKEIGCDFVQGYYIQRPTLDVGEIKFKYKVVKKD
jgi:EAL domain-containing protein (putative c-di-GMP-specific phosphodiesterase class I)